MFGARMHLDPGVISTLAAERGNPATGTEEGHIQLSAAPAAHAVLSSEDMQEPRRFREGRRRRKMRTMIAVTVAVVMWVPGKVFAEEPEGVLVVKVQDLKLTDAQEAKIAEIRKEFRPKVQEAVKQLVAAGREEVTKVQAVLTPEQKEKVQAMKEERKERRAEGLAERIAHFKELDLTDAEMTRIAEIRKEYHPRIAKALESLKGTLTAEQRTAREEALKAGKKRREVIAALNLTDAQKEKVEGVCHEVGTLVREEMEKIRDVLSEGQKEKLQEFREERHERIRDRMAHRIANLRELNLTDQQKSQIAEIRKEYRPRIQEAGNRLREVVREEVEMIVAVLKA
jgi:Spy/CpxP family protein refolding chaperone